MYMQQTLTIDLRKCIEPSVLVRTSKKYESRPAKFLLEQIHEIVNECVAVFGHA